MGIIKKKAVKFTFTPKETVTNKIQENLRNLYQGSEVEGIEGGQQTLILLFPNAFLSELNDLLNSENLTTGLLVQRGFCNTLSHLSPDIQAQVLTEIIVSKIEALDEQNELKDYLEKALEKEAKENQRRLNINRQIEETEPGIFPPYLVS